MKEATTQKVNHYLSRHFVLFSASLTSSLCLSSCCLFGWREGEEKQFAFFLLQLFCFFFFFSCFLSLVLIVFSLSLFSLPVSMDPRSVSSEVACFLDMKECSTKTTKLFLFLPTSFPRHAPGCVCVTPTHSCMRQNDNRQQEPRRRIILQGFRTLSFLILCCRRSIRLWNKKRRKET